MQGYVYIQINYVKSNVIFPYNQIIWDTNYVLYFKFLIMYVWYYFLKNIIPNKHILMVSKFKSIFGIVVL